MQNSAIPLTLMKSDGICHKPPVTLFYAFRLTPCCRYFPTSIRNTFLGSATYFGRRAKYVAGQFLSRVGSLQSAV